MHVGAGAAARRAVIHRYALAGVLLLRATDHALFAGWLISQQPGWLETFRAGANFALLDGALGILVTLLIVPLATSTSGRWLAMMTLLDGMGRLAIGVMLRAFPGLPVFVVTIVSFFGLIAPRPRCSASAP